MTESPLQAETTHETTTFRHFDRDWTVPIKRHVSHLVQIRDRMNQRFGDVNLTVAETMLGPEQFEKLLEVDPDEDQLNEFVGKITAALGLGEDPGNS